MFDDLKESLGNFRKDVEEEAEVEEADESDADETSTDEAQTDEVDTDEATGDEVESSGTATGEDAPPTTEDGEAGVDGGDVDDGDIGGGDIGGDETTGETVAPASATPDETEADDAVDSDAEAVDQSDDASDETDDDNPGIGQRAKSLATGKVYIDEDDIAGPLRDLEFALLENDVEMSVAEAITDRLRAELVGERKTVTTRTGSVVEDALHDALLDVLSVAQFDLVDRIEATEKPVVVVFTGVNGVGKTTSIAKVSRYLEEHGLSSVLANGDTFRAGANEQIEEHAKNLGRKLISHDRGGDPAAVIYDAVEYAEANDVDVVLGDTAGRLHTDEGLMDQLEKIGRVVGPDFTLFVDEAVAGQDAVNRAREFDEAATVDGAILTKADADASGGAAISVAHVTGKPILFLGVGQGYDDLERFDPEAMVERLLE